MGSRIRDNVQHLFECFCEVGVITGRPEPRIVRTFPDSYKGEEVLKLLPKFVYPCDTTLVEHSKFSFVLTCGDSKWMFGFCRHEASLPLATVLLSHLPLHDTLYNLLEDLVQRKKQMEKEASNNLINISDEISDNPFQFSSEFMKVLEEYYYQPPPTLTRHELPSIPKNVNLTQYYCAVNYKGMISMMAALLHERRIIVVSKKPSRISACVQAANDLLYPLVWQHIFIPVLPKILSEYLLAPMPYLIGVPESVFKGINKEDIGDVVILDADKNEVFSPFDDIKDFPSELIFNLNKMLTNKDGFGDNIARIFLRVITYLIGGYKEALRYTNGTLQLDSELFVSSRGSAMKPFLQKLITLQTFQQFIEDRIELIKTGSNQSDEFERECYNLEGQKPFTSRSFSTAGGKISIGTIMRQVKEKTHPAMETAVESVKTGSRGVRNAYRGLRSRVDTTINNDKEKQSGHFNFPGSSGLSKVKSNFKLYSKEPSNFNRTDNVNNHTASVKENSKHETAKVDQLLLSTPLNYNRNDFEGVALSYQPPSPLSPLVLEPFSTNDIEEKYDLITLSDRKDSNLNKRDFSTKSSNSLNTDEDLLQEYGLDFNKFSISRKNWTTFDE